MAVIETWFEQDLKQPVRVHHIDGNIFTSDSGGNLIGVKLFSDGEEASLSGSVNANVVRPDGATVVVTGTLSGNACSVILPQSAYVVPGFVTVVIKLVSGGATTTVCAVIAENRIDSTDTIVDPGHVVPDINELLAMIEQCEDATEAAEAAATKAVRYDTTQSLTTSQKTTARNNTESQKNITVELISGSDYRAIIG